MWERRFAAIYRQAQGYLAAKRRSHINWFVLHPLKLMTLTDLLPE